MIEELQTRSESQCELCTNAETLEIYEVASSPSNGIEAHALLCATCRHQLDNPENTDANHWRCLNDSMWSQVPVIQVLAWRMLTRLRAEGWPQDLLEILYLEDDVLAWAKAIEEKEATSSIQHRDSNGALLASGDTVTLIKDLDVKGANFTAKRGTAVRGISLVADNAEHIEGRVSGQRIVILTKFVKKSS